MLKTLEAVAPATSDAPASPRRHHAPVPLDAAECRELLARVGWGVIATVGADGHPYSVPIGYALGKDCVYIASGPGQKRAFLEADPRVCLTVAEVDTFSHWRSVVVRGRAEPVEGLAAHAVAVAAFATQRAPRARAADARRFATARMLRISLDGMTGRSRGGE